MPSPRRVRAVVVVALALGACSTPVIRPIVERQDPARFERCADPAGKEAYDRALALLQEGRDAEALPLLQKVVEVCPEHVPAHCYYQDAARHVGGEAAAAMNAYYAGLADSTTSPVPEYAKARLLQSNYQRKVAIDRVLQRHGDFAWAHLAAGRLDRGRGQLGEAVESFRRAIERHPELLAAHLELAETLDELGRESEARLPYENYLRGAPNDLATVRDFVHLLLYKLNKPGDARAWIAKLLAEDPEDEGALMDRAAADWRSNDLDAALRGYLAVLEKRPDNARAALNIAYLHYDAYVGNDADRQAHWPKARKAFELFLRLVRPADGYDYFEKVMAVPYRLQEIEKVLGPGDGKEPTLDALR